MLSIADLRENYTRGGLSEAEAGNDPFALFRKWLEEAIAASLPEPNAMTLATVGSDGQPSARVVLLKGFDEEFTFFTNTQSLKGREIAANPRVALVFHWHEFERQVRVQGIAEPVRADESDQYFQSRPVGSRLGAWASEQSEIVTSRNELERNYADFAAKYADGLIPRPPHWGGYRVRPNQIEFWQGRPNRLHDRLRFRKLEKKWIRERLAP